MIRRIIGVASLDIGGLMTGLSLAHLLGGSLPLHLRPDLIGKGTLIVSILLALSKRSWLWPIGAAIGFFGGAVAGFSKGPLGDLLVAEMAVACTLGGILLILWSKRYG